MRLFHKETELQILERQLHAIDGQISEAQASLRALKGNGHIDPILQKFLQERLAFDYEFEKQKFESIVRAKETQIAELEREKKKLLGELNDEIWKRRLKDKDIRFYGENVVGFEGSVVKLKCPWCGTVRLFDARDSVALKTILSATSAEELQAAYSLGNAISVECGNILKDGSRCGFTFEVKIARIKI